MTIQARDYQLELVDAVWDELMRSNTALAVLPTGGGKTVCIGELMKRSMVIKPSIRIQMIMGRIDLVKQTERALSHVIDRKKIGVYCGSLGRKELSKPITVASIQSISGKDHSAVDLLVVDEVHNLDQKDGRYLSFIEKAQERNPKIKIVGFTATPFRSTGVIYGEDMLFHKIAYRKTIKDMIAMSFLCEPRLKGSEHAFDVSHLRVRAGEYRQEDVNELVSNNDLVFSQVKDALSRMGDRQCVVWACANINHCNLVADQLMNLGERVTTVHSNLDKYNRNANLEAFRAGSMKHMSFVSILSEGFDHPPIDCVVLMRPTRSPVLYVQTVGRGLRIFEGKKDCLVLDYGQVIKNLGPLDEPNIKDKKKQDGEAPVKECPTCHEICFAGVRECPDCGHVFPEPKPVIEKLDQKADVQTAILSAGNQAETVNARFIYFSMYTSAKGNECVKITYCKSNSADAFRRRWGEVEFFVTNSAWAMERLEKRLHTLNFSLPKIPFQGELCLSGNFEILKTKEGKYDRILKVTKLKEELQQTDVDQWSSFF